MQRGDRERRFTLRLWHARVLEVGDRATSELEQPGYEMRRQREGQEPTDEPNSLQPMGVSANCITVWLIMSSGREVISVDRMNHCLPAKFKTLSETST